MNLYARHCLLCTGGLYCTVFVLYFSPYFTASCMWTITFVYLLMKVLLTYTWFKLIEQSSCICHAMLVRVLLPTQKTSVLMSG